jgi:hypothetical protein
MTLVPGIPELAEYPIEFRAEPRQIPAGREITLEFRVLDPKTSQTVEHFEIIHEKLFHLFLVSQDLEFFAHLHPEIEPDGWFRLRTTLPKAGTYRLLADFDPTGGTPQLVAKTFSTAGYTQPLTASIPHLPPDLSTKQATNLQVELTTVPLHPNADANTMLFFRITPAEGLEPYLGVWGHLLAVSDDSIDTLHIHPFITGAGPPAPIPWATWTVPFKIFFPRGGTYKIWVQFERKGVLNTVSFTLPVQLSQIDPTKVTLDHVSVRVTNSSPAANTYTLYDNVCNRAMPDLTLGPYASAYLSICSSEERNDGYGSFRSQLVKSGIWNKCERIRDGEACILY